MADNNSDWVVTKFKIIPKKANNWKSLMMGTIRPKVGDLLFAYHDGKTTGNHDHVAIYLGVHDGHIYVAEGISVSGTNIQENDKKVHIAKIEDSRLGYDTDVITHFAHCNKTQIQQTNRSGLTNKNGYGITVDYKYNPPTTGKYEMKHFVLKNEGAYAYKPGQSSLTWNDKRYLNKPATTEEENLTNLVKYLLDPLYEIVEKQGVGKIYVSSGYRNEEVNKAAGGVSDSQHKTGQAVDIQIEPTSGDRRNALLKVAQIILRAEEQIGLSYDQMILEKFDSPADKEALRPKWIHISYKDHQTNRGYNRTDKLELWDSTTGKYKSLTRDDVLNKPTD